MILLSPQETMKNAIRFVAEVTRPPNMLKTWAVTSSEKGEIGKTEIPLDDGRGVYVRNQMNSLVLPPNTMQTSAFGGLGNFGSNLFAMMTRS